MPRALEDSDTTPTAVRARTGGVISKLDFKFLNFEVITHRVTGLVTLNGWPEAPIPPAVTVTSDLQVGPLAGLLRRGSLEAEAGSEARPTPSAAHNRLTMSGVIKTERLTLRYSCRRGSRFL